LPTLAHRMEEPRGGRVMERSRTGSPASATYSLATAAYNEEQIIEQTIQSIVNQTVTPRKWIIVSDGSTDRTDEIVKSYAAKYDFIELDRISENHPRNFTAQVNAINRGFATLKTLDSDFIGNLDADITVEPDYFASLMESFSRDPKLGLAGGYIYERQDGEFRNRAGNSKSSVAHGVQLFRHECVESIGGYAPFSWGGADTHACVRLRMMGWKVESVPGLKAFHHRPTGAGFGGMRYTFRGGLMDHYFGTHPIFELFRVARRMRVKPYLLGGLVRLSGFLWGYFKGAKREVPPDYIRYLRREQMAKLRQFLTLKSQME
jgi:poly-beta-1,6-N-acetyl-D-glucosamine synthase